jgi:hypothetical protein
MVAVMVIYVRRSSAVRIRRCRSDVKNPDVKNPDVKNPDVKNPEMMRTQSRRKNASSPTAVSRAARR